MAKTANRLRIIGGRHRGRVVRFADAPDLRPTPDRVRETLFNWLGQDLAGRTTLEPYAGSGVLSLEALSRGAAGAVAVDRSAASIRALRDNASMLSIDALETLCDDALAMLARETRRFDVIFLDPPFADDPWPRLFALCAPRLAEGGFIYAESGRELSPPEGLALHRHGRAGRVHYHLLRGATP
ncbi:MAG TPA: 16S rRNA (guanine(966)-N(2))-methyltransferase RsmD [Casimicrobiaceae bacterium]|jgi:16S rRNA (guanine(966)-N(2))-methyltransferase RsmD